jgi:hypothetical protein
MLDRGSLLELKMQESGSSAQAKRKHVFPDLYLYFLCAMEANPGVTIHSGIQNLTATSSAPI